MKRDSVYRNHSGYYDPTAGKAITDADTDRKTEEKKNQLHKIKMNSSALSGKKYRFF